MGEWKASSLKPILEAVLFAADSPLGLKELKEIVPDAPSMVIKNALSLLMEEYRGRDKGIELVEVAQGYRFQTKEAYKDWVLKGLKKAPRRLGRAALETLAIIAYKQPITRAEIERIRGVDVSGVLRHLLSLELIRISGRKDCPGRPLLYGTTRRFLEVFHLKDLSELPAPQELKGEEMPRQAALFRASM